MGAADFFVEYIYKNQSELAEIKPCCGNGNMYYYDIVMKNQYQFTVTPYTDEKETIIWKISLKNSDKQVDPVLIDIIGQEIEKHLFL